MTATARNNAQRLHISENIVRKHVPINGVASAVHHRRRLARAPASCPCSASWCPVHVQVHGVVPLVSV